MVKIIIITDIPFWLDGAGNIVRLKTMINFLMEFSQITVVFLAKGHFQQESIPQLKNVRILYLKSVGNEDRDLNLKLVANHLRTKNYDTCIVEYIHNSYFLKVIPDNVTTILDTHDIISDRNISFMKFNYSTKYLLSDEVEYKIFKLYDYVIFISQKDFQKSVDKLDPRRMILAPHPVLTNFHSFRSRAKVIGFLASDYIANIDSIIWFLSDIWPKIPSDLGITLNIYGDICKKIPNFLIEDCSVILKGFQFNLSCAYSEIDIAINPVRIGAGLKIKNIEAMANGIPLLTTSHGASGIEDGIGNAFLVADNEDDFRISLIGLIENINLRKSLSQEGLKWVKKKFNIENCFKGLKYAILKSKVDESNVL